MAQDRDRDRDKRSARRMQAGETGAGLAETSATTGAGAQDVSANVQGQGAGGRSVDDAAWTGGETAETRAGSRELGGAGGTSNFGRFYSRAHNRFTQRGELSGRGGYVTGGYSARGSGEEARGPGLGAQQRSGGLGYQGAGGYGAGAGTTGYRGGTGSTGGVTGQPERGTLTGRESGERSWNVPERNPQQGFDASQFGQGAVETGAGSRGGTQTGFRGTTSERASELDYGRHAGADYGEEPFNRGLGYGATGGTAPGTTREYGRAEREGRRSRWQREPLTAREIMTKNPKAVLPDSTIREVAQIMRDENTGVVPVVDQNNRLQGIITDRDIVMRSIPEGKDPLNMRASELMTDDVEAVTPDESLQDVVRLMGDKQIRRVPVVDQNDRLVGIISMADVATRADYDEDLQDALEDISARRSFWSKLFG